MNGWLIALIAILVMVTIAGCDHAFGWSVKTNAKLAAREDAAEHGEDALVNLTTGEVLEPGTRRWNRQAAKMRVVFREE